MKRSLIHNALASLHTVLEETPEGGLLVNQIESIGSAIDELNKLTAVEQPVAKPSTAKKTTKKVTKKKTKKQVAPAKEEPVDDLEDDLLSSDDLDDLNLDTPVDDESEAIVDEDDLVLDDDDLLALEDEFNLDDVTDPMVEEAYKLLKDESKPSPTLLQNKLRIGKVRATEIFKGLVDEGRITKPKRAPRKTKSMDELLSEIPKGEDPIVETWFARLLNLPEDRRAKYVKGVKLKDVVTMKGVRAAVKAGGDMTLVEQIKEHTDAVGETVENPIEDFTSTPEAKKYGALVTSVNKVLDDGGKLYDHMTRHGCNKGTLLDLRDIAKAVKG